MSACSMCRQYELCRLKGEDGILCSKFTSTRTIRKKPTYGESSLQQECKRRFDDAYPGIANLFFAVPNGADVGDKQRKKLSAEGLVPGVADTILLVPSRDLKHHCLCVEFKRKTHKVLKSGKLSESHTHQSPEQKEWQKLICMLGGRYEVVWDVQQFKEIISDYLGINNFKVNL